MGGAACVVIITGGNLAYGTVERFSNKYPSIHTERLEAAISASCEVISFAGLYYLVKNGESIEQEYTRPIISLHDRIRKQLPDKGINDQNFVNELANQLIEATENVQKLFE